MIFNYASLKIGDSFSLSATLTKDKVMEFAELTGDKNPIHVDEHYASNSPFKKTIAHGFFVGSIFSRILGCHFPGNGTIYLNQTMKFLKPVFVGETITGTVEVISKDETKKWVTLKTSVVNSRNKIVVIGEALIIPPNE